MTIHATAIVDPSAKLAADVEVGPYSIIGAEVEIAAGCRIGPHVVIKGPTRIGTDNRIYQFSSIGDDPQDKKYAGEETRLVVGDRNVIREYVTLNRGTASGRLETTIGSDNLFLAYAHVAHDCIVGNHTIFANAASIAGHVEVGDYAILGGFTNVHQFCRIGRYSFNGLGSTITQDIPPYSTAAGNRSRTVGINKHGLRRNGFSEDQIRALHKAFRELLFKNSKREAALAALSDSIENFEEVREFVEFVQSSERGIAR